MSEFPLLDRIVSAPPPANPERAALGLVQWRERAAEAEDAALAAFAERLAAEPQGEAILKAIFGNSPFLTQCLLAEVGFVRELMSRAPEESFAAILAELDADTGGAGGGVDELMTVLRRAKRRTALLVALADIGGLWNLEQVTGALSDFADRALTLAARHLLAAAAARGELALPDPEHPDEGSGFAVLGMGKLGARELNYSSDIDLIVLYDQDAIDYLGPQTPQDCFVRLTQELVRIFHERTAEGYVFRTDLRLRPEGGATPLALPMIAAENYYESQGQNWERAAMIKARPVAGDLVAGRDFLARVAPFIWRKYLDFAAIQDIHSIKRQIHDHRGHARIAVAGHNIKLGRGGIREIEFFAQTQQLIAGGRDRRLRVPGTAAAIRALAESGRLGHEVAEELVEAYEFLRRLEHRLQMIGDEQTHTLPTDRDAVARLAVFMGCDDGDHFSRQLLSRLERVQSHYAALFEDAPPLGHAGSLAFTGTEDDPETLKTLSEMGFGRPEAVATSLRKWHHGRYRAMRSTRARELLTEITPALLEALARTANPDLAFAKLDEFLGKLPAGIQLFSLFHANPGLLDLVAEVMGDAPRLASYLSRNPALFDGVLTPGFFDPLPQAGRRAQDLASALEGAADFEEVLDVTRRWTADAKFQVGVQIMRNLSDSEASGPALSDIAEVLIRALQPLVEQEFGRRHGGVPGAGMAVVGLGKLGGREMTAGSDLDLILVYDFPPEVEASDGAKPLAVGHYFARLSQRFIAALTALTAEGRLYDVDMRLRPSGKAGPIATSLHAFELYQRESAWTWEHMALTRARVIGGPKRLAAAIPGMIRRVLTRPRDPGQLVADVAEMRERVEREHGTSDPWNVKYARGGLLDLEFISQYLQLRHAADRPEVLDTNTSAAFRRLGQVGALSVEVADELIAATVLMRNVQGLSQLSSEGPIDEESTPPGLREALARAGGAADFGALKRDLVAAQARTLDHYRHLIEAPAHARLVTQAQENPP